MFAPSDLDFHSRVLLPRRARCSHVFGGMGCRLCTHPPRAQGPDSGQPPPHSAAPSPFPNWDPHLPFRAFAVPIPLPDPHTNSRQLPQFNSVALSSRKASGFLLFLSSTYFGQGALTVIRTPSVIPGCFSTEPRPARAVSSPTPSPHRARRQGVKSLRLHVPAQSPRPQCVSTLEKASTSAGGHPDFLEDAAPTQPPLACQDTCHSAPAAGWEAAGRQRPMQAPLVPGPQPPHLQDAQCFPPETLLLPGAQGGPGSLLRWLCGLVL